MSKKSRNKGHNFERQVALMMNEEFYRHDLPIKLKRDLAQYQESDRGDLLGWVHHRVQTLRQGQPTPNRLVGSSG